MKIVAVEICFVFEARNVLVHKNRIVLKYLRTHFIWDFGKTFQGFLLGFDRILGFNSRFPCEVI